MKNQKSDRTVELEAELIRLNALVRSRRKQLVQLQRCPHTDCECRTVWKDFVEKNLAQQMGRIRRQVRSKSAKPATAKRAKR